MTVYHFISQLLAVTIGKVDPISTAAAGLHITQSADALTNVVAKNRLFLKFAQLVSGLSSVLFSW